MTRISMIRIAATAAALAIVTAAAPRAAEAQTITTCYSQKTGTMYRVGAPNTPAGCSKGGTEEAWNAEGPAGQDGVSGWEIVTETSSIISGGWESRYAVCPVGKVVVGGGIEPADWWVDMEISKVAPQYLTELDRWAYGAKIAQHTGSPINVKVHAICVTAN